MTNKIESTEQQTDTEPPIVGYPVLGVVNRPVDLRSFQSSGLKLYDIQPPECRMPLKIENSRDWKTIPKRVFNFDPTHIYDRINESNMLNPYQRHCSVPMSFLFQKKNGVCSCGCGLKLEGRRKRWATDECKRFGEVVFGIIAGYANILRTYRWLFTGSVKCEICDERDSPENAIELDHLHPVKFGGGGGWLSNYQFKCKRCHRKKTNKDFGHKQKSEIPTLF
jgi:5-methylcytosine-specific restriction endonuclease McrA